ncbi:hypothetical protein BASA81_002234 [Batrachochytrium salamandrivorans]|nr:hypothetical protein BASA81_002234 [Batrachochytrium salamandrivorans]
MPPQESGAVLSVKVIDKRRVKMNYSDLLLEQFRLEAKILRSLSHPNITSNCLNALKVNRVVHVVTELVGFCSPIAPCIGVICNREGVDNRDIKLGKHLGRSPLAHWKMRTLFLQVKLIDFDWPKKLRWVTPSVLSGNNRRELTAHTYFGTWDTLHLK